jgi:hypothetical protein
VQPIEDGVAPTYFFPHDMYHPQNADSVVAPARLKPWRYFSAGLLIAALARVDPRLFGPLSRMTTYLLLEPTCAPVASKGRRKQLEEFP